MHRQLAMLVLFATLSLPMMGQQSSCYGVEPEQEDLIDSFCQASEDCGDGTFQECWSERQDEHAAAGEECMEEFDEYLWCIEAHGACYEGGDGMFYWQDGTCDEVVAEFEDCAGL